MRRLLLLYIILQCACNPLAILARTISGSVYDIQSKEAIPGVTIRDISSNAATTTDSDGRFKLNVATNTKKISLSSIGYNDKVQEIGENSTIIIYLETKTHDLAETTVFGNKNDKVRSANMGLTMMNQTEIKNIPTVFGEADIIKSLQLQPGVSAGIEGFAGMMVRGGNDDENLFLIDGNPVYQMNHLGGLFSAYNVEAVKDVSFFKGAFPARYGGRLSSVVDITTADGDFKNYHGNFMIGLTSGNISMSGPVIKDKTAFSVSLRRSWLELISIPALAIMNANNKKRGEKVVGGYSFTDLNLKINQKLGKYGSLSLMAYYGNDNLKIGEHKFATDKDKESGNEYFKKDENKLNWGNKLLSLKWSNSFSDKLSYDLSLAYMNYKSGYKQSVENSIGIEDESDYEYSLVNKEVTNSISDISINSSLIYNISPEYLLRFGVNYVNHSFMPEGEKNRSSETQIVDSSEKLKANEAAAYIDAELQPLKWLKFNAGLRGSLFNIQNKTHTTLEPRISINAMLNDRLSFKMGYARMSQFVQQVSDNYISLPTDFWMPITEQFKPLTSNQISAGLYYSLGNQYQFSVEGYYKTMNNLLEYKDGYNLLPGSVSWSEKLASGSGKAYGIDFMIEKNFGRLKGFVGYGLMWTDRQFEEINNGKNFPSKYDNRHKLNISLNFTLKKNVELNCGWTYMTGNRVTLALENYQYITDFPTGMAPVYPNRDEEMLNYYSSKNNVRLPDYHRLDLGINFFRPKSNNRMGIWNISVYNAYSRMNPIVIQKSTEKATFQGKPLPPRFRTLSIFPIIPSVSYTYKF